MFGIINRNRIKHATKVLSVLLSLSLLGCSSTSNTQKGAVVGAGAGAVVGGVMGKVVGNTARGAIIGAVVGGVAGAMIGRDMDKQAEELEADLDSAEVTRVGEAIVVTFDSGLLFDFDSATLRPEARANLRDLSESLRKYENTSLMVIGHTDDIGAESYNNQLSVRRAESASSFVVENGVASSRVTKVGKGESDPVASNETEAGRQLNRRVEAVIYASEEYRKELEEKHGGGS